MTVVVSKSHDKYGFWDLIPLYLGAWTHLDPLAVRASREELGNVGDLARYLRGTSQRGHVSISILCQGRPLDHIIPHQNQHGDK